MGKKDETWKAFVEAHVFSPSEKKRKEEKKTLVLQGTNRSSCAQEKSSSNNAPGMTKEKSTLSRNPGAQSMCLNDMASEGLRRQGLAKGRFRKMSSQAALTKALEDLHKLVDSRKTNRRSKHSSL